MSSCKVTLHCIENSSRIYICHSHSSIIKCECFKENDIPKYPIRSNHIYTDDPPYHLIIPRQKNNQYYINKGILSTMNTQVLRSICSLFNIKETGRFRMIKSISELNIDHIPDDLIHIFYKILLPKSKESDISRVRESLRFLCIVPTIDK